MVGLIVESEMPITVNLKSGYTAVFADAMLLAKTKERGCITADKLKLVFNERV